MCDVASRTVSCTIKSKWMVVLSNATLNVLRLFSGFCHVILSFVPSAAAADNIPQLQFRLPNCLEASSFCIVSFAQISFSFKI
ncbi:hypothetical protein ACFX1X_022430 [Malus domestica]